MKIIPHNKITNLDNPKIITDYHNGLSILKIAKDFNVSRQVITRIIQDSKLPVRSRREANLIRMSNLSEEGKKALTKNANTAFRKDAERIITKGRIQRAFNVEDGKASINIGPCENELLWVLGQDAKAQYAVEKYNIDIMFKNIAIEVKTNGGSNKARTKDVPKIKTLLSKGFKVCYVDFVGALSLNYGICYITSLLNVISKTPRKENHYWIIKCGLQQNPISRNNGRHSGSPELLPPEFVVSLRERELP